MPCAPLPLTTQPLTMELLPTTKPTSPLLSMLQSLTLLPSDKSSPYVTFCDTEQAMTQLFVSVWEATMPMKLAQAEQSLIRALLLTVMPLFKLLSALQPMTEPP